MTAGKGDLRFIENKDAPLYSSHLQFYLLPLLRKGKVMHETRTGYSWH
jgi:hypothetical protein